MAKIKHDDIREKGNPFKEYTEGLKELIGLRKELVTINKSIEKSNTSKKEGVKKLAAAERDSLKIRKDISDIEKKNSEFKKEILKTAKAKLKSDVQETKLAKELLRVQEQEKQKQKEIVRSVREKIKGTSEYNAKVKKAEKEAAKELATQRRIAKEKIRIDAQQAKINAKLNKAKTNTNKWSTALKSFPAKFNTIGNVLGGAILQATNRIGQGLRNAFGTVVDFEKSMAKVKAVSGATNSEFKKLNDLSRELGATTEFTASQVAGLELSLSKLGFNTSQIVDMTGAILDLSTATDSDLGQSAEVVGNTLRGFGLEAAEASRVTDVMAKSFSSSALDMQKFSVAMSSVAPVAKNANVSLEETTAMLGILVDRGLDASTAGTSLRNIFLELSKQGITFEDAMSRINNAADKNAVALELFGKRGATTASILAETGVQVDTLTTTLNNAEGAASEMAFTMRDTLSGDIDTLKSAMEGAVLDGGTPLNGILRTIVKALTTLVRNLDTVIVALGTYIVTMKLSSAATKEGAKGFKVITQSFANFGKKIGEFIANNGLAILVTGLALLTKHIYETVTAQTALEKAQDKINEKLAEESAELQLLSTRIATTNTGTEARNKLIDEMNNKYGELIGRTLEYGASEKELRAFMDDVNEAFERRIELEVLEESYKEFVKERIALERELGMTLDELSESGSAFNSVSSAMASEAERLIDEERDLLYVLNRVREENEKLSQSQKEVNKEIEEGNEIVGEQITTLESLKEKKKELEEELQITDINDKARILSIRNQIEAINKQIEAIEGTKKVTKELDTFMDDLWNKRYKEGSESTRRQTEDLKRNTDQIGELRNQYDGFGENLKELGDAQVNYNKVMFGTSQELEAYSEQLRALFDNFIGEEDIDFLAQNLLAATDILQSFTDAEIKRLDEKISKQDEATQKAEEFLEKQIKREEDGLANDVDLAKRRLAQQEANEKKLEDDKAEAVKRQKALAKTGLTIDYLAELGKIALYAQSNIFANAATGGGWAAGVVAIQTALATGRYAASLNQINAQQFGDGGWIDGKPHSKGGVMINAEGEEFVVNKNDAQKNAGILEHINSGGNISDLVQQGLLMSNIQPDKSSDTNVQLMMLEEMKKGNSMVENNKQYYVLPDGTVAEVLIHKDQTTYFN